MGKHSLIQVGYSRGMNENVKQSLNFASGSPLQSVLWLENYNPNYEHESLTKRFGLRTHLDYVNVQQFAYNIIDNKDVREADDIVMASTVLGMSNPLGRDAHIFFAKRFAENAYLDFMSENHPLVINGGNFGVEATGLISNAPEWNISLNQWEEVFTEPFSENVNGHFAFMDNPGWYTLGILKDFVKYGESIIFTTALENLSYYDLDNKKQEFTKHMYPVYYWRRWDITKAREEGVDKFWNGITFNGQDTEGNLSDKSIFSRCRVNKPGLSLVRERQFKTGFLDNGRILDNADGTTELTTFNSKVNLVIWEEDLLKNPYYGYNGDADYDLRAQDPDEETRKNPGKPLFMDNVLPLGGGDWGVGCDAYIHTMETLKTPEMNDKFVEDFGAKYTCPISTLDPGVSNKLDYTDGEPVPYVWKMPDKAYHCIIYGENTRDYDSGPPEWYSRSFKAMTFGLPDYLNLEIPRHFFKGDKIPFLLTATVNGVEIVVEESVYTVRTESRWTVPTPYNAEWISQDANMIWAISRASQIRLPNGLVDDTYVEKHDYLAGKAYGNPPKIYYFSTIDKYNTVMFTIRMDYNYVLDAGVESINVYVAKPDDGEDKSLYRSIGVFGISDPPVVAYREPVIQTNKNKDYTQYKLVKRFLIAGEGKKQENWDWKKYNQHEQSETESNAWMQVYGQDGHRWIYAVPQKPGTDFPDPYDWGLMTGKLPGFSNDPFTPTEVLKEIGRYWTPDFILWDYPSNKIPLTLQSSGEYYQGLGAELIQVIKGRTFIGNCIDSHGDIEQGVIRYTAVQGGAISPDVFNKEDKLKVGHLKYTALVEYREQLICFNRQSNYRIIMPNVAIESTWEFLDAQVGQGTFNQKTTCVTPYGVAYGNESGVWISDGRKGSNLVDDGKIGLSLVSLWQKLAMNKPYIFNHLTSPGEVEVNDEGFNPFLEFVYDEENDELNIITPVARGGIYTSPWAYITPVAPYDMNMRLDTELRLIYSFASGNWRVETYKLYKGNPLPTNPDTLITKTYSKHHKLHYARNKLYTSRVFYSNEDLRFADMYYEVAISDNNFMFDTYLAKSMFINYRKSILASFITHEVGDGKNDFTLDRVLLEIVPRDNVWENGNIIGDGWHSYEYNLWDETLSILDNLANSTDPMLWVEFRNKQWTEQDYLSSEAVNKFSDPTLKDNWSKDLIAINYLSKLGVLNNISGFIARRDENNGAKRNPFRTKIQTPGGSNSEESYQSDLTVSPTAARESVVLLAPHHTKFRSARLMFASEIVAKIKTMDVVINILKRRSY